MQTVTSAVAYDQGGSGPSLVLVHGTTADRTRWASVRPRLEEHFTVTSMDRRGRGDSGDAAAYAIEREFEDVAAVVAAVAAPVLLFGHSYGALCALGAALQAVELSGLILYEPWINEEGGTLYTPDQLRRLDTLLAAGDREGVVKTLFAEIAGFPSHEMDLLITAPFWSRRVAMAHTIPRESRAEESYRLPADALRTLSVPVLLLTGGDSPPLAARINAMLQSMLPDARIATMPGQQHIAMTTAPDLLVGAVLDFWRSIR
jgi:pimeloyl-ACP methyl ester carboxylesterase